MVKKEIDKVKQAEQFMTAWRNSDFYDFVIEVIETELRAEHLNVAMFKSMDEGTPLSNEEVGQMAKIEFQANLRIQNIKDALE